MILPLVAVLLQTVQGSAESTRPAERPVRVWLDSSSPLTRGAPVRVYVRANEDGHLVVLRKTTDGRIQVLFPGNPADEPFVRVGTYEIRAAGDRAAFVVAEPDGTGWVLAALSPSTPRFDEFVRAAAWDPDALVPSWGGADPEGALTDIVQRMLGDGYFNYDIATYTVAPALPGPYAAQDSAPQYPPSPYAPCLGCTVVGFQLIIGAPVFVCDEFITACLGAPRLRHHGALCGDASPCGAVVAATALALGARSGIAAGVIPSSPRFVGPRAGVSSPPIGPRSRVPDKGGAGGRRAAAPVAAIALLPGRLAVRARAATPVIAMRSRTVAWPAAPTPTNQVRLTLSPTARDELLAVAALPLRGAELVAAPRSAPGRTPPRSDIVALQRAPPARAAVVRPAVAEGSASGVAGRGPMHAVALPLAVWTGAATVAARGRRR